jgi:hypothetical protein
MKIICILTVGILFLLACRKDDNNVTIQCGFNESSFIGKWKATKIEVNGRDSTNAIFTFLPCYKTLVTEFKSSKIVSQTNTGKDLFGQPCEKLLDRNWKLYTNKNINYLITFDSFSSDTSIVNSIDCNQIVTTQNELKVTINKQ